MNVLHISWLKQGSADQVSIFVDVPFPRNLQLDPEYYSERKVLKLYGKRTGKLRAKVISWFEMTKDISQIYKTYENNRCYDRLDIVKFKHLIPQVEKHLSWAMLSV